MMVFAIVLYVFVFLTILAVFIFSTWGLVKWWGEFDLIDRLLGGFVVCICGLAVIGLCISPFQTC